VQARDETPVSVPVGSTENSHRVCGEPVGNLVVADSAAAVTTRTIRQSRPVRRWVKLGLAAITLGTAAYGFSYANRPEACYRRALHALGRDDFEQAQYQLRRLQGLPKYEPHACLINGILLLQEDKQDDALEEFRLAVDHPDTRALALTLAGRILFKQRKFLDAEAALVEALRVDPNLAEAHGCLGAAYYDISDFRRALVHLERAAKMSPDDPRPYQFMAPIHQSFQQDELAIEDLRELLRRGAANPGRMPPGLRQDALFDLAQLQVQLLRHQEAIETLKDADETADTLALLAECQFALGDLKAARDVVAQALQRNPDLVAALLLRARLAMEAKEVNTAIECLNRALQLRPKSRPLHVVLSQALHSVGQDDLAEQHAQTAAQLRELDQEYVELNSVAVDEPRNLLTCFRLGLMAERLGLENSAAGWYRAVLLIDPQHTGAREHLLQLPGGLEGPVGQP
jgi:tetratricopeptide (TPR) repeat protein